MTRHRPATLPEAIARLSEGAAANQAATERIWVSWLSDERQVSRTGILIDMIARKIIHETCGCSGARRLHRRPRARLLNAASAQRVRRHRPVEVWR
jgi:hypothetical protein